jgi:hypothetical protein
LQAGYGAAAVRMPAYSAVSSLAPGGDVVVLPGRGLRITRPLSFERWLSVGAKLSDIHTSSAWCLGDWLVYGESAYSGRYRDAVEQTSLDYQTLRNYAWVARRFPLSRRRDSLSFGHHAEVAALPSAEQDYWLRKAEELSWPVRQLRQQVRASLSERSPDEDGARDGDRGGRQPRSPDSGQRAIVRLHIQVARWQLESCQAAARKAGLPMEEWAVLILDHAARHQLGQDTRPQHEAS